MEDPIEKLVEDALNELDFLEPSITRLSENLARTYNLVGIYKARYGSGRGRRKVHSLDVLRAAVVFLHASLEDFLRSLAAINLPNASEDTLNTIPLKGLNTSGRPEKFFLGKLVSHKGKTVDEVIEESISHYLERTTYNDTQEIAALLVNIGVDVSKVNETFPALDQMMRRRHQIVHRADRVEGKARGKQYAQSLNPAVVTKWIESTRKFMGKVLSQLAFMQITQQQPE